MPDLNDLRLFEKVASLQSFSAAARALGLPKSSISRGVSRLEAALGIRLLQRTTRQVTLTSAGIALMERCRDSLRALDDVLDQVAGLEAEPRGPLRISAGVGFGINVLAEQLPSFIARYPDVDVSLQLSTRHADLLGDGFDVAIRLGPMSDSSLVSARLGVMHRYLCAAPAYLERRGTPASIDDVKAFDTIEMPGVEGRPRTWVFSNGSETKRVVLRPRLSVDEALTIYRLVCNGAGIGIVSGYLCGPEIVAGRLVRVLPAWSAPDVEVNIVFPSRRELSPTIRAFVDHMKTASVPGRDWQHDVLVDAGTAGGPCASS